MGKSPLTSPWDTDDAISDLQEKVLTLLEEAGIPTETNDRIVRLIDDAELLLDANSRYSQSQQDEIARRIVFEGLRPGEYVSGA